MRLLIGGEQPQTIPARSGRAHLHGLLRAIATAPRGAYDKPVPGRAPTDLSAALEGLRRPPRRRGMAVLISDFLTGGNPVDPGLGKAAAGAGGPPSTARGRSARPSGAEPAERRGAQPRRPRDRAVARGEHPIPSGARTLRRGRRRPARRRSPTTLRRVGAEHLQLRTDRDWLLDVVRHVRRSRIRAGA